ncbi:class I SAM-dependent methyltransferase [Gloeomargaritales cyanobacterium VI4D9]|nr:class I SAM-dependent methyltransferase [Gloeomargaritales cyanobacterium VI4D9]
MSHPISQAVQKHCEETLKKFGCNWRGVDWGGDEADHYLRNDRMLELLRMPVPAQVPFTLLDVGCGYGSLLELIQERNIPVSYTGIDISPDMIEAARQNNPNADWLVGDILEVELPPYDFIVCSGVLTLKLDYSIPEMADFVKKMIKRMYDLSRIGIAFNIMTTYVNFTSPNLYYSNPNELLSWCMFELTPKVRLDHSYPLFDYTIYLYKPDIPQMHYGGHRPFFERRKIIE